MTHKLLIKEANEGSREMQYQLGLTYCIAGDISKAIYWLEKAKAQNDRRAAETLDEIKLKIYNLRNYSSSNLK